jgi:hypothetical protein
MEGQAVEVLSFESERCVGSASTYFIHTCSNQLWVSLQASWPEFPMRVMTRQHSDYHNRIGQ